MGSGCRSSVVGCLASGHAGEERRPTRRTTDNRQPATASLFQIVLVDLPVQRALADAQFLRGVLAATAMLDERLADEEIAASGKAVRMYEIAIEHMSGKEIQER